MNTLRESCIGLVSYTLTCGFLARDRGSPAARLAWALELARGKDDAASPVAANAIRSPDHLTSLIQLHTYLYTALRLCITTSKPSSPASKEEECPRADNERRIVWLTTALGLNPVVQQGTTQPSSMALANAAAIPGMYSHANTHLHVRMHTPIVSPQRESASPQLHELRDK